MYCGGFLIEENRSKSANVQRCVKTRALFITRIYLEQVVVKVVKLLHCLHLKETHTQRNTHSSGACSQPRARTENTSSAEGRSIILIHFFLSWNILLVAESVCRLEWLKKQTNCDLRPHRKMHVNRVRVKCDSNTNVSEMVSS